MRARTGPLSARLVMAALAPRPPNIPSLLGGHWKDADKGKKNGKRAALRRSSGEGAPLTHYKGGQKGACFRGLEGPAPLRKKGSASALAWGRGRDPPLRPTNAKFILIVVMAHNGGRKPRFQSFNSGADESAEESQVEVSSCTVVVAGANFAKVGFVQ